MIHLNKLILVLSLIFVFSLSSCKKTEAANTSAQPAAVQQEFTGYLMDVTCGTSATGKAMDKSDVLNSPKDHTVACLLACEKSGFGIMTKGNGDAVYKFTKFDDNGTKLSSDLLHKTTKKNGMSISVKGTLGNNIIMVSSIEEKSL